MLLKPGALCLIFSLCLWFGFPWDDAFMAGDIDRIQRTQRQVERQQELLQQQELVQHEEELKRIERETEPFRVTPDAESLAPAEGQLEHMELMHVRHFAETLAELSYDVNGDGRFDLDDDEEIRAGYEDALAAAEKLSEEVVYMLDQDSDGLITEADRDIALENLEKLMGTKQSGEGLTPQ